jgi:lantibiotic biosynthesis dehydratase-like protein
MHNAPVIVRIAGLPVSDILNFSTELCEKELTLIDYLQLRLFEVKKQMVEMLHEQVKDCSALQRPIYVNLKRDCFNNRSVRKYLTGRAWPQMDQQIQVLTTTAAELERELANAQTAFAERYKSECLRNEHHLLEVLAKQPLVNGIALASASLARQLPRLSAVRPERYKKKERKLELGAIRYVSRSALKLSPYATLTRLGLALVKDDCKTPALKFLPGTWTETSIVRIKRYILEQFVDALLLYEPFKSDLLVTLNSTLRQVSSGKYQFIRPGQWREVPPGIIKYFLDSQVTVRLSGLLIDCVRDHLGNGAQYSYGQLKEGIRLRLNGSSATQHLDQAVAELVGMGYLNLRLPWHTNDASWEEKALQHFKLSRELDSLTTVFEQINSIEDSYYSTSNPIASIEKIETLVNTGWDQIRALTGITNTVNLIKSRKKYVYQDVMIANHYEAAPQEELLHIPASVVNRLIADITPLMELSVLQWHGYDFLHTIGAVVQRHPEWNGCVCLPDLLTEANELWQDYVRYDLDSRREKSPALFNPLQLEEINALHELRQKIRESFAQCTRVVNDELWIDQEATKALAREIPAEYRPIHGPCMILQAADRGLERWVLNRVKEGTGRLGSRFVPLMSPPVREFYTSALERYGQYRHNGQKAALMDLMCINGDTLNVHPVQTPFVLEMPGSKFDLPNEKRIDFTDLWVRVRPGAKLPQIYSERAGQWLIPVHLGGAGHDFLSSEIRFLCLFGPCEMDVLMLPRPSQFVQGQLTVQRRIVNGSIILKRRRWIVSSGSLPRFNEQCEHELFAQINRWRIAHGIPDRVFLELHIPSSRSQTHHKPQYIDFTSPLFVRVLQAEVPKTIDFFTLEEALPPPNSYPHAPDGSQWAIEFLLDTIISQNVEH